MGFFKKRMLELKEHNRDISTITCPYCFERFSAGDVKFRATHNDDIYRLDIDPVYNAYRKRLKLSDAGPMAAVLNPAEYSEKSLKYDGVVPVQLKYGEDFVTSIRLCPFCHNVLTQLAGKAPSSIISVIGASQVGKSVYMTSLIHTLQNISAGNFNASCLAINQDMNRRFKDVYENPLFVEGRLLDPTQKERHQEPLIFEFKFINSRSQITLVFFDVAGEGMVDREYLKMYASHIKNSSGIMFLIDPSQIKTIRNKISLSNNEEKRYYATDEPTDVLISLKDDFMRFDQNGKIEVPTAVTLTKSDMLTAINDTNYLKESSNIFKNYVHKNHFDLNEYANINGEVESLIEKVDLRFQNALKANFLDVGYFAVSALGRKPIEQKINSAIEPIRVDEPFLWLLYKLGYIEGTGGEINDRSAILHKRKKRGF